MRLPPRPAVPSRLRRSIVLVGGLLALACTLGAASIPAAAAASGTHRVRPSGTVRFAVARPVCAAPRNPALARCTALRRVDVPAGTADAVRYVVPHGVTLGPSHGYTPRDLALAYGFDPSINRSSQTVAVIDWYDDPHALADLDVFDRHYGIRPETAASFRKVNQRGRTSPLPRADSGSSLEIALDVEAVRAVCHTCRILLVEADGPTASALATAVDRAVTMGADEISNSYGAPEQAESARTRAAYDHPGVVITASSGDDGWYDWDWANDARYRSAGAPSYPATDPHVVSVGGTTLVPTRTGRWSETVWNGNGTDDRAGLSAEAPRGASGGGCSRRFTAPPWQAHEAGYAALHCAGGRSAADLAAIADPATGFDVYNSYSGGGWNTFGGTSLAAPVVAAMYALAGGARGSSYPAASLYVNAATHPRSFEDVTGGGNGFCGGDTTAACSQAVRTGSRSATNNPNALGWGLLDCSYPRSRASAAASVAPSPECNASPGFDGPSGLGTVRSLRALESTAPVVAVRTVGRVRAAGSTRVRASVLERVGGTHPTSFAWSFGDGHSTTTTRALVQHRWRHAGTYTVRLRETDNRYQRVLVTTTVTVR